MQPFRRHAPTFSVHRCGFTLMEALLASAILLMVVVAVTSAITSGQQHALEAKQRITASLAADDLMGRILNEDYESIMDWDGFMEAVGNMKTVAGSSMPSTYADLGRSATITPRIQLLAALEIYVDVLVIDVVVFDRHGRELASARRFVPEPSQ